MCACSLCLPCHPPSLHQIQPTPQPYDIREAKEGAAQLLAALAHLTNLRKLDLTNILLETLPTDGISNGAPQPGATAAAAPAAEAAAIRPSPFSALTASSVLESLVLAYRSVEVDKPVQPLPTGAVAALLPPGRQLTALTGNGMRKFCARRWYDHGLFCLCANLKWAD